MKDKCQDCGHKVPVNSCDKCPICGGDNWKTVKSELISQVKTPETP